MPGLDPKKIQQAIAKKNVFVPSKEASDIPIDKRIDHYNSLIKKYARIQSKDLAYPVINRITVGQLLSITLTPVKPIGPDMNFISIVAGSGQEDGELVWDTSQVWPNGFIRLSSSNLPWPSSNTLFFSFQTIVDQIYSYEIRVYNDDTGGTWSSRYLVNGADLENPLYIDRVKGMQWIQGGFRAGNPASSLLVFHGWFDLPTSKSYFLDLTIKKLT